jgi:hypothetical protein
MKTPKAVKEYLAKIGRKGGKAPSPHKKYESDAERQRAYRERKKKKGDRRISKEV